ncbi:MAG: PorT family protein [Saprospiraceae bacterium]|nr:PorT family protein [Saprospiraceae bacterium]MCF8252243.1 PorT family protein [Saprospiraceae bacterium]MCF8282350.1 PorT family protein [Bacteroidales bacterium]MCF8313877.1 PorT family protein [Saprospiraceae bacterium]MCF8442896.1 PorT family protein [Saprospiraceae bacterium]
MKKIVAIAAFFALLSSAALAQQTDLRLGFQVSPTFSWMTTDDTEVNNNGTNLGLKLGARGEVFFRDNYAFLIGLGFAFNTGGQLLHSKSSDAWQRSDIPNGVFVPFPTGTDLRYNLQYVEIPFGLKFRTNEIGYLRYYAELPIITLGFKSQARGQVSYTSIQKDKIDIKKEVTPLALSWGVGGGIEYSVSDGTSLIGGVSFQRGFTDVTKDYSGVDEKATISSVIIHLGVMF